MTQYSLKIIEKRIKYLKMVIVSNHPAGFFSIQMSQRRNYFSTGNPQFRLLRNLLNNCQRITRVFLGNIHKRRGSWDISFYWSLSPYNYVGKTFELCSLLSTAWANTFKMSIVLIFLIMVDCIFKSCEFYCTFLNTLTF